MNVKLVAEKTFNLLKGFGFEVSSYNKEGDLVIDPMEATRFAVESPNVLVRIDPLDKHLSLKTGTPGETIEKLRPMLKELAQDYLLDFDYSVFDKQIKPKGERVDVARKSKEEYPMSEELNILKKLAGLPLKEEGVYANYVTYIGPDGEKLGTEDYDGELDSDMMSQMASDEECKMLCDKHDIDYNDCVGCLKFDDGEATMQDGKELPDGTIAFYCGKEGSLKENPLQRPPGANLKFGQDKGQKLSFDSADAEDMQMFALTVGQMFPDDPDLKPDNPMRAKILARAYMLHKRNNDEPKSAVIQAKQAEKNLGYDRDPMMDSDMSESITEASLGKMTGSRKSSYQPLADSVKIIVRHNKEVNEEVRGARSRNIHSILIQRGEEKFKMAENNLSAARAMARHLHNGGETFDEIGTAITEMSKEFRTLKEFIGYVRKAKLINEDNEEFVTLALENINIIKNTFKRLSGVKSYANAVESVHNYNNVELLQDDLDLEAKFTETHFDDKVANAMENLRAMSSRQKSFENHITKAIESETFDGLKDLIAEDDLLEFESLNQQLGHRVHALGNSATDSTLGKYLHSISDKLNAGGQLSQFEYGAVKSCLLSAGQHNVSNAPMSVEESYEAFMDRFDI